MPEPTRYLRLHQCGQVLEGLDLNRLGRLLVEARKAKPFTQEEVVGLAGIKGFSVEALRSLEKGRTQEPNAFVLFRLAEIVNLDLATWFDLDPKALKLLLKWRRDYQPTNFGQ